LHLENHFEGNQKRLDRLFWLLLSASVLLVAEIVLWLFILGEG
jgi:hypothetical protein